MADTRHPAIGFSRSCVSTRQPEKNDKKRAMCSEILIYESGNHTIEVRLDGVQETLWLSLQQMAHYTEKIGETILAELQIQTTCQLLKRIYRY